MCFVFSKPVEVGVAGLVPPAVFTKTRFAADEVVPRNHAAGHRFIHPHRPLLWILRNVTPARSSGRPGGGDISTGFAFHDSTTDTALEGAAPNRSVVASTALVVTVEPVSLLAQSFQICSAANGAAEIAEIEIVGLLLFSDAVVQIPELDYACVELIPVVDRTGRR